MTENTGGNPTPGWYANPADTTQLRWWDGLAWTDQVQPIISEQAPGEVGGVPAVYTGTPIIVVTTPDLPGYRVLDVHGEVFGITVRARNAFSNAGASFRTLFGGEVKGYTKLLSDSRLEAVERLRFSAHQVGGNAVLAMRFDTGQIADLMNEVAAYGTAVTVERIEP
jgi:uncharacterized protein YbjQ (UPF0145 family)